MDLRYEKIRSYIVQRPSVKAGGFFYIDFQDTKDTTATFKNQFILFLKGAPGIKQSGLRKTALRSRQNYFMDFFNSAVEVLQTLVVALGGGLCVWGGINLLEGYGNDNPGANAHVR